MAKRHEWSPAFAPHVKGYYEEREMGSDGMMEEAPVGAVCTLCNATFQRKCASGHMRQWIATFAKVHLHRHPLLETETKIAPK